MREQARRRAWLIGLALSCAGIGALPLPARAQDMAQRERGAGGPMLGGALEDMCRGAGQPSMLCATYLRGAFEGLMYGQASMADGDTSFCLPDDGVTLAQVRAGFLTLMLSEPDRRDEYASVSLLDTLQDSYPCADAEGEVPYIDTASAHVRTGRTAGALPRRTAHRPHQPLAHMLR